MSDDNTRWFMASLCPWWFVWAYRGDSYRRWLCPTSRWWQGPYTKDVL